MQTLKQLTRSAAFCGAVVLIGAITALADPVNFIANSSGTFSAAGCATCTAAGSTLTNGSTTITFSSASPTLNVTLVPPGEPGLNSTNVYLGQFTASSGPAAGVSFANAAFTLTVNFTVPADSSPAQTFSATLSGLITTNASSSIMTWTSPTTLTFTSVTAGTFTLVIEPFTPVNNPGDNPINIRGTLTFTNPAAVSAAEIPEPATLLLLGTGLLGIARALRRKQKSQGNED
ncbi:MAG TPA: PEP-CTERM sorting domain-containing protein [Blastocatellia bacterium]|nr:PEP-CTERM sorting domain-containing protein [Blastocatellia bacterium]